MKKDKLVPKRRFKEFINDDAWEQRKLGEVLSCIPFKQYLKNPEEDGKYEIIQQGNEPIIGYANGKAYIDFNDVVIFGDHTLSLYKPKSPFFVATDGVRIIKGNGSMNGDYLNSLLEKYKPQSEGYKRYFSILSDKECYITSNLDEQRIIGNFFANLDNLITLQQRKLKKLKETKSAYLSEMFPREGENYPKLRFAGFNDPWEQCKLSEIATMHARIGWQNLRTSEFLETGEYMLITGTDFENGAINYSTCHYVEQERYEQDRNIQIANGNILITKDGTLGKVAYVQGLKMPATLNAGVFNVKIKNESEVDAKYLFQYLRAPYLMDYATQKATGGTIKHLNQNILVDFPVMLPSKEEQSKIGECLQGIDSTITLHQRKLEKLENIKKAYLNEMFV